MIVTYFGFGAALVLPVFVLTLPAAVEVVRDLVARVAGARAEPSRRRRARAADRDRLLRRAAIGTRSSMSHDELVALSQAVESAVGPDARMGAVVGAHYSVFLERPVYSLQIVAWRANAFEAADRVIEKHAIDTIVLSNRTLFDQQFADYFRRRYGEPERVGPALIWRMPGARSPARGSEAAAPLASLELRIALLEEGVDALGAVAAGGDPAEAGLLERMRRAHVRVLALLQEPLRLRHGEGAPGRDRLPRAHARRRRSSSGAKTRFARPMRSAVSASIGSPVSTSSFAQATPTRRSRRLVPPKPGMIPRFTSGCPKRARLDA